MNDNGWWKGTNAKGDVGIFPYNYVQLRPDSPDALSFPIVKALYDFEGSGPSQLAFKVGDLITIMKEIDSDWSEGKLGDKRGIFPISFTEATGNDDEDAAKAEMQKWEKIEAAKKAEAERLRKEREEAERKLREEEERLLKEKKAEEERLAQLKKEDEARQAQEALIKEAKEAKALAAKLKEEKAVQEAEIRKAQLELEQLKAKAEAERREQELKLQQEAIEARRRAEMAERELEQARAESALLRKKQERKDARRSVDITKKIAQEKAIVDEHVQKAAENNEGGNPKRAPKKKQLAFAPVYVDEGEALPEKEEEPEPEAVQEEPARNTRKPRKKVNARFAHLGRGGETCKVCDKGVGVASRVKALGNFYHAECFTCSTCSKILRLGDFVDHKGEPYCKLCHKKGFGPSGFGFGGALNTNQAVSGKSAAVATVQTDSIFKTGYTLPRKS
mmetsp:Transcript_19986/g.24235  ORF Transcript_19986/g.24235 Transcript_19986/m.24235 type:complete len:448 (-) Transcript_19986:1331-2674(-)